MTPYPDRSSPDPYALTLTARPLELPPTGGADLFAAKAIGFMRQLRWVKISRLAELGNIGVFACKNNIQKNALRFIAVH